MTFDQFLFVLLGPLSVFVFALVVLVLVRWQDRREDRRRAENRPRRFGIDYL
jgi:hypothetical protein